MMQNPLKTVRPDVLKLGLVSFLTDISSEMIFSVFAVFFTTVAGASSALLGLVEGLADFSASFLNYLSGRLSDAQGKRKVFVLAGYGFSTLAKTILLISSTISGLALFRIIERLGKGFRGPPRDAWLSAIADPASRGYSFGIHKAMDKAGAVLGPLLAYGVLTVWGETRSGYQTLFWMALVPALISILVLSAIREQPGIPQAHESMTDNWQLLDGRFKRFLLPAGLFSLSYFSLGFLLIKAHQVGFDMKGTILLYALFNITCVIAAPLVGALGDRIGRKHILMISYGLYALINLGFVLATSTAHMTMLFAAYGIFYAMDDSQSKAFIADLEPSRRASAIGIYNFVCGSLYIPASLIAGALWTIDPDYAFATATALALAALSMLTLQPRASLSR